MAPDAITALAVATNVKEGSNTSSSLLILSSASNAACKAAVPELTATTCLTFKNVRRDDSNSWTLLPPSLAALVRAFSSTTLIISSFSSLSIQGLLMGIIFNYFM